MSETFGNYGKREPHRTVILSLLDGHGVLFHEAQQRVYQLDPLTTVVWRCLWDDRASYEEAIRSLVELFGCPGEQAKSYVEACLATWQAHGLIPEAESKEETAELRPATVRANLDAGVATDLFEIAGASVSVHCPDKLVAEAVREIMGHLHTEALEEVDMKFDVVLSEQGYSLSDHHGNLQSAADADAIAVNLKNSILQRILDIWPHIVALHAGALLAPSGAVLLAGTSGRGKTTLAAVLNSLGWPSIADDIALLDTGSSLVKGLAFAYAAKPGSWPLLRKGFSTIEQQPTRTRPDGRQVKYVQPHLVANLRRGVSCSHVLFPSYKDSRSVVCKPFGRIDALHSMLSEAINSGAYLTAAGFDSLCRLINGSEVMQIEYSCAYDAADFIRNVVLGLRSVP